MTKPPLILISPDIEKKGNNFGDTCISLSETYRQAITGAGGIPVAMPATASCALVAEGVRRCDGALLTGSHDIAPSLYTEALPVRPAAIGRIASATRCTKCG